MKNTERDMDICLYYQTGKTPRECAKYFKLSHQRIGQIISNGGVKRERKTQNRREFLGVNVSEATKDALTIKAFDEGTSVSQLASDALDALVEK